MRSSSRSRSCAASRSSCTSATTSSPTGSPRSSRTSVGWLQLADPPREGPEPGAVRRRGARERPRHPPHRKAEGAQVRPRARRRLHVRRHDLGRRQGDPAQRPRRSSRSPTRSSGWSTTARASIPTSSTGWWKDTGKIEDMLEANRIMLDTFTARGLESVDGGCRVEGKVVLEPGARIVRVHGSRPGGHRAGRRDPRRLRRPVHRRSARTAASTAARSRTRSSWRARGSSGSRSASRTR